MGTGVEFVQTSNIMYIGGDQDQDGVCLGYDSGSKVGFFGATPIVQPTLTPVSTSAVTTTLNETRITRIQTLLVNLGLCATA